MGPAAEADDGDMESAVDALTEDAATTFSGPEFGQGLRAALRRVEEPRGEPAAGVEANRAAVAPLTQEPISPELALVCPELRRLAIAALPHRDPDGWAAPRRKPEPQVKAGLQVVQVGTDIEAPRRRSPHLAIAAAAFVAVEAGRMAVFAAVTIGGVAGWPHSRRSFSVRRRVTAERARASDGAGQAGSVPRRSVRCSRLA
jgi:hypothetical protein